MGEIEDIHAFLGKRDKERARVLKYAIRARRTVGKDPDHTAAFLAKVCHDHDKQYGSGSYLALEWMLDHFMYLEWQRHRPLFLEIMSRLKDYSRQRPFEYFNDAEAFSVPAKNKRVLVCGKYADDGSIGYLVIETIPIESPLMPELWHRPEVRVRRIWPRLGRNCIGVVDRPTLGWYRRHGFEGKYGDARDPGHVLTCDRFGKADKTIWKIHAPQWFFFEINTLHTQLSGEPNDD